jgi:hypothetical protein
MLTARTQIATMVVAHTQNMRLRNAFACLRQYKLWIGLELPRGLVITLNISVS